MENGIFCYRGEALFLMYHHIAYALARGCIDLYYVNIDSEEYIEFHADDEHGALTEARRGTTSPSLPGK